MLCLPLLAALRREQRDRPLHFAGVLDHGEVLAAHGAVDAAFSSEDLQLWAIGGSAAAARRASERLAGYARIVGDAEELRRLPAECEVAVFTPLPRERVHASEWLLRELGLPAAKNGDHQLPRAPGPMRDGRIVLHPGAGAQQKRWPRERWQELAAELACAGIPVTVAFGPVELERDDPRRWQWPAGAAFAGSTTATQLAQQLLVARACVANDSGPAHLAAALAVPTVAVFGPTDPAVWAPRGAAVRVVGGPTPGPPDVAVGAVAFALRMLGAR